MVALLFLHKQLNMIHRDIKPGNILLNSKVGLWRCCRAQGEVKLTDFGVSDYKDKNGTIQSSWSGTTCFMSISLRERAVGLTAPRGDRRRDVRRLVRRVVAGRDALLLRDEPAPLRRLRS